MTPERFRLVEEIFHASLGVESAARREFIVERCADDVELCEQVLALVAHDDAGGVEPAAEFRTALRGAAESAISALEAEVRPSRVGSYRIIRTLGEGGFGVVYLAEQDRPKRTVALKLLRTAYASGEAARRFEYEARILARLRHPGIAQIFEAGVAEVRMTDAAGGDIVLSQPFLALEYIEGPNLIDFALGDGGQWPALPVRDRLVLLARACDALQHAHQNGVIHRDLKPDNILVSCDRGGGRTPADESVIGDSDSRMTGVIPKLLDFGVARVTEADEDLTRAVTATGRMIGTLAYMSPEQVLGERDRVDTRSDVYSMGVLMYQLVSGRLPYEVRGVPLHEAGRIIREREPDPIALADRSLRDDLNAVIRTAMAKERSRRYASMGEFAADIRRLLSGEPVAAKRSSGWYVLRKAVWRHRVVLGVASGFVLLLGASSIAGWSLFASAQRARAESAALLRDSYLRQASAVRAAGGVGRRFEALDLLSRAREIRMGSDLRSEAIAALCEPDLRVVRETVWPHEGAARGLGSATRVAGAVEGGGISLVDPMTGATLAVLRAPDAPALRIVESPSGRHVAACFPDPAGTEVLVWDGVGPEPVLRLVGAYSNTPIALGESERGAWIAVPDSTEEVGCYDISSGQRVWGIRVGERATGLAPSHDGRWLAVTCAGGRGLRVFGVEDGAPVLSFDADIVLRSPSWSADDGQLGAGGSDGRIHRWRSLDWQSLDPMVGHRASVATVVMGQRLAASTAWDGTSRVWDLESGEPRFAPISGATVCGVGGDRLVLASGEILRTLELVAESPRRQVIAMGRLGSEASFDFNPDGTSLVIAGSSGVTVYDADDWSGRSLTEEPSRSPMFRRDGESLAALVGGALWEWPIAPGSGDGPAPDAVERWRGSPNSWASADPDGHSAVIYNGSAVLRVDVRDGRVESLRESMPGRERPVLDKSGRWLFLGTWRGAPASVIDLRSGEVVVSIDEPSVRGTFSSDGSLLAAGVPGAVLLYSVGRWDAPRVVNISEEVLSSVAGATAVSADGGLLAYVIAPSTVRLADARTGETLAELPNPERFGIPDLGFSADGRRLVLLTLEDRLIVWNLERVKADLAAAGLGW